MNTFKIKLLGIVVLYLIGVGCYTYISNSLFPEQNSDSYAALHHTMQLRYDNDPKNHVSFLMKLYHALTLDYSINVVLTTVFLLILLSVFYFLYLAATRKLKTKKSWGILRFLCLGLIIFPFAIYGLKSKYYYQGKNIGSLSLEQLEQRADSGDPLAEANLGAHYALKHDYPDAKFWFQRAADKDSPDGQFALGTFFHFGEGVEADQQLALDWFEKAATHNYPLAEYFLGDMYAAGEGTVKNDEKAIEFYTRACRDKIEEACKKLSQIKSSS